MKTKKLIFNFFNNRKKSILLWLICSLLYYPLQMLLFTVAFGKLFDKIPNININKNKAYVNKLVMVIIILYVIINISSLVKEKIESILIPTFNNDLRNMIFEIPYLGFFKSNTKCFKIIDFCNFFYQCIVSMCVENICFIFFYSILQLHLILMVYIFLWKTLLMILQN